MLKEKRDLLGQKKEQRQAIHTKCLAENRSRTADEVTQWNTLGTEIAALEEEVRFLEDGEREARANATIPLSGGAVHSGVTGNTHISQRDQRDLNGFDLGGAIRCQLEGRAIDGINAEMIQEGRAEAIAAGASPVGNIILPYALVARSRDGRDMVRESVERRRLESRDMTATGTTSTTGDQGGQTIVTTLGRLYESLYSAIVLQNLGANFMTGMVGNYTMPRFIDADDPAFKTENAAADESSPTFAGTTLSPKRLPTFVEISNQLLAQSNYNITQVVQRGLISKLSSKADKMGIQGSGSSNQPRGILNTSGIGAAYAGGAASNSVNSTGAASVWADVVNLYKATSIQNANFGALGYLTNPLVTAQYQSTPKMDNTAGVAILPEGARTLNGYQLGITNNVPSTLAKNASGNVLSALLFGNFNDFTMAFWGGIDLLVNPYSRDTEGLTRINAALYMDCGVARPESFAAIKDIAA